MADDVELIRQIAHANFEAFEEFYEKYNRFVFRIVLAVLGEQMLAEEVTLDIFVRVWQRAELYRSERGKVSSWLIAITRHHAIDILRRQKTHPEPVALMSDEINVMDDPHSNPVGEQVETSLQMKRVREAFYELPVEQRQALNLAYFKGYSHSQIAQKLHEPLGTIKTRIRTGMQKLRELLETEE